MTDEENKKDNGAGGLTAEQKQAAYAEQRRAASEAWYAAGYQDGPRRPATQLAAAGKPGAPKLGGGNGR